MGMYFEDLQVGETFVTPRRTLTEADVVAFAGLTGDYNPIHTDAVFAEESLYGQRIAHGLLGLAIVPGLMSRIAVFDGTAIAMLGIDEWRFVAPIFIGDTIHVQMTITGLRRTRKPERGVVERRFDVVNQRDETTQVGNIALMVHCREAAGG